MFKRSVIFDENFWKAFSYIERIEGEDPLRDFFNHVPVDESELEKFFYFLKKFDYDIKIIKRGSQKFLKLPDSTKKIEFIKTFTRWLSTQCNFFSFDENSEDCFTKNILDNLNLIQKKYPSYNLFNKIERSKNEGFYQRNSKDISLEIIITLENSLIANESILLETKDRTLEMYCLRLLFLDGELTLVGEDINEGSLVCLKVNELISVIKCGGNSYKAKFSNSQINEFIGEMRSMGEIETRLILRIKETNDFEFNPPFHFLSKPYITINKNGDLIWAASIEDSDEFLWWITQFHEVIEILGPPEFKAKYEKFYEDNIEIQVKPSKKAS